MNYFASSLITLTLYFTEHPDQFDSFWRAHNMCSHDTVTFSPLLWEEIFRVTFGASSAGLEDERWDELFGKYRMMEALREFANVTAL